MSKTVIMVSVLSLALFSCEKKDSIDVTNITQSELPSDSLKSDSLNTMKIQEVELNSIPETNTYTYKGEDGMMSTVTFLNTDSENTMTVKMDDKI